VSGPCRVRVVEFSYIRAFCGCSNITSSVYFILYTLQFLDFVVNRLFMNLSKTSDIDVVKCCQDHLGFDLSSVIWSKRVKKLEAKFHACNNLLCNVL